MASLEELLNVDGVVAAGEFNRDGTLIDFGANMAMPTELARTAAQFCATVTMLFNTLAPAFSRFSGMNWVPQWGWTFSGGDFTVALGDGGTKGVFVETNKADFNRLFAILAAPYAPVERDGPVGFPGVPAAE